MIATIYVVPLTQTSKSPLETFGKLPLKFLEFSTVMSSPSSFSQWATEPREGKHQVPGGSEWERMHACACSGRQYPQQYGQPQNVCTHHPCYEQIVSSSDMSPMLPVHRLHRSSKGLESEACVKILALRLMSWENLDPWPLRASVSPAVTQDL